MDEMKTQLTLISEASKKLESLKEKLTSDIMSDEQATITIINKELTEVINELNEFLINNAEELKNLKINNKWLTR